MNLFENPFFHLSFANFSKDVNTLITALENEEFHLKDSDLFTFFQTNDLENSENTAITELKKKLLSEELLTQLEQETNTTLSRTHLDMFGTIYTPTHYLLPHDDRLEGRALAYILYLSDNYDGALCLYGSKDGKPTTVAKKIKPTKNMLVVFKVSEKSFHEVEEVLAGERLTITGWFHYG